IGSSHTVGVAATIPVGSGTRYAWDSWSDGVAISHTIVATADGTFTASFVKQVQATVVQEQGFRVTTAPGNLSFKVDGTDYSAATTFWFAPGTYHIVSVETLQ